MLYVIADRERNGYDDSDFVAVCIDGDTGRTREIVYGTTRFAAPLRSARAWVETEGKGKAVIGPIPADVIARYLKREARHFARCEALKLKAGPQGPCRARGTRFYQPRKGSSRKVAVRPGVLFDVLRVFDGHYGRSCLVRDDRNEGYCPADALRPVVSSAAIRAAARARAELQRRGLETFDGSRL